MCDDVAAFVSEMKKRGVSCSAVTDRGWGLLTEVRLPGGGKLGVYQPRHARPKPMAAPRPRKPKPKPKPTPKKASGRGRGGRRGPGEGGGGDRGQSGAAARARPPARPFRRGVALPDGGV